MAKLLTRPHFWPLFWTQFLGAFNDNVFKNILVILIAYQGITLWKFDPTSLVALSGGIFILPYLLFSATAGQICDRYQKARIIRLVKLLEVLLMAVAVLGFVYEQWPLLLFCLFLMGTQSTFFGPIKYGILPDIVGPTQLVAANALIGGSTFIAILLGTILGGLLGGVQHFIIPAACTLLGLSILGLLAASFQNSVKVYGQERVDWSFLAPAFKILRRTWRNHRLFPAVLGTSWLWFLGAALLSIIPSLAKDVFFGQESVATFFLALFTVGMAVGSLLTNVLSRSGVNMGFTPLAAFLISILLLGLVGTCRAIPPSPSRELLGLGELLFRPYMLAATFCFLGVAILAGIYSVSHMTFIQLNSPQGEVSKTIACNNIWSALFMVLASGLIIMLKALNFSLVGTMAVIALLNALVSLLLYLQYRLEVLRLWAKLIVCLMYRIEVRGKENFPKNGPFVICSNHVSYLDWLFIIDASPLLPRFIIDHNYYFYWPFFPFVSHAGLIPISPRGECEKTYHKAFAKIDDVLKDQEVLGLFPEGRLTRDGELRSFQPGLCKILSDNPVPVVPLVIQGLWGSWFSHSGRGAFRGFPRPVRPKIVIHVGPAIPPNDNLRIREVEERVRALF